PPCFSTILFVTWIANKGTVLGGTCGWTVAPSAPAGSSNFFHVAPSRTKTLTGALTADLAPGDISVALAMGGNETALALLTFVVANRDRAEAVITLVRRTCHSALKVMHATLTRTALIKTLLINIFNRLLERLNRVELVTLNCFSGACAGGAIC